MRMGIKIIWSVVVFVGLAYLAICIAMYMFQSRVIFFPDMDGRELHMSPANINLSFEDVHASTDDGETIHGWYVPADEAKVTLLFSHGNAGNISHRLESIALFNSIGLNVLIYDYRAYGQSTGKISEQGFYQDVHAMWRVLTEDKKIKPENIVLFGRSLGAAITSQLATRVQAGGVILESPFTSVPDMGARLYPFLPVRLLSRFQLSNLAHVKKIKMPLLLVHSKDDEIIPYQQGEQVYHAANEPKDLLTIRGDHNGGFIYSGRFYIEGLESFLIKNFPVYEPVN